MSDPVWMVPDREWLHIHIVNGEDIYVFTDNAHWRDNATENWKDGHETTFKALDGECFVGSIESLSYTNQFNEKRVDIRIPLQRKLRYGKFGMPYLEPL